MSTPARDHGGAIDAAIRQFGGARKDWLDLSTGINPHPYPVPEFRDHDWAALPDSGAFDALCDAARTFWGIPGDLSILAAPGASSLIARLPALWPSATVRIDTPTYNEHEAAFRAHGWNIGARHPAARVVVHPNNPTGELWDGTDRAPVTIIDESFCDTCPDQSHVAATSDDTIILKSFGKFWGLAGLRLGFAIGPGALLDRLTDLIGPWAVSGPALATGTTALRDHAWAQKTRARLSQDAQRLDEMARAAGLSCAGGSDLFRLYDTDDAHALQQKLASHAIWTRVFPYSERWIRLGLPGGARDWSRLEAALHLS